MYIVRVNIRWHRSNYIVKSDKYNSFEKYGVYQILSCNKFNATEIYQEIIEIHGDDDWQNIVWPSVLVKNFKFATVEIQPAIVTVQFINIESVVEDRDFLLLSHWIHWN